MTATNYIWDFANDSYLMEKDDGGTTTAVYTVEPVHYGKLLSQRRGNVSSHYHFDGQQSTRQITSSSSDVTDSYNYSAFGVAIATDGVALNPFRYIGTLGYFYDDEVESHYIRSRFYIPVLGVWNSQDPALLTSVLLTHLYKFVNNNPITWVDPSGWELGYPGYPGLPEPPPPPKPTPTVGEVPNKPGWLFWNFCLCTPPSRAERASKSPRIVPLPPGQVPGGPNGGNHRTYPFPATPPDNIGGGGAQTCIIVILKCPASVTVYHFQQGQDPNASMAGTDWSGCEAMICGGDDSPWSNCQADKAIHTLKIFKIPIVGVSQSSKCGVLADGRFYE